MTVDRSGAVTGIMFYEMKAELAVANRENKALESKVKKLQKEHQEMRQDLEMEKLAQYFAYGIIHCLIHLLYLYSCDQYTLLEANWT